MTTLPNMGIVLPVLGADRGTWDDRINTGFALVDAHDHTSGKGVAIPVAGLDIDDDIVMGGFGFTGVGRVDFSAVATLAAGANVLFVDDGDGELYWRTTGGANVKLTDGSSINTALVGGIVGDYSTVGAEVAYSDADQVYTFKDHEAPTKKWARLASGPVRIYQFDTTESVYVEHAIDAALAAPYTVTWPAALPGSTTLVQISSAGVVSFSNTVTGTITAGALKYTTAVSTYIHPASYRASADHHAFDLGGFWTWLGTASEVLVIPVEVRDGETLTGFTVYCEKNSDASNEIVATLMKYDSVGAGAAVAGASASNTANAPGDIALTDTFTEAVSGNNSYAILITCSDATPSSADEFYTTVVTRTRP